MSFFFGANSRYPLYLLWRTTPQKDAAATGAIIFCLQKSNSISIFNSIIIS